MSRPAQKRSTGELEQAAASWVFRREAGLTATEQAEFERWQAADPRHVAVLARHDRVWAALARPRENGQADYFLDQLAVRATRRRYRRLGAFGALGIILMAGGIAWRGQQTADAPATARALVISPPKQTLPDGSIVELNARAKIAVNFSATARRVLLNGGEAHFQVAHENRPFVVTAGGVEFRAVGTAFTVQIAGTQVEVLVTEGRVAVEKSAANPPPDVPRLPPLPPAMITLATVAAGNRMVVALAPEALAPAPAPTAVATDEMAERLAWRVPKLDLSETPLAEAVAMMNRHNRVQFVIDDTGLARLPVSGLFRADRMEAFVRILEANFGVKAELAGDTIRLHRNR